LFDSLFDALLSFNFVCTSLFFSQLLLSESFLSESFSHLHLIFISFSSYPFSSSHSSHLHLILISFSSHSHLIFFSSLFSTHHHHQSFIIHHHHHHPHQSISHAQLRRVTVSLVGSSSRVASPQERLETDHKINEDRKLAIQVRRTMPQRMLALFLTFKSKAAIVRVMKSRKQVFAFVFFCFFFFV
jgi:hypothetical protein